MPGEQIRWIGTQTWSSRLGECIFPWQQEQSVIRFSSESWPEWLRNPFVLNFQIRHRAAPLTPLPIATQDLQPEPLIRRRIESQARESWPN